MSDRKRVGTRCLLAHRLSGLVIAAACLAGAIGLGFARTGYFVVSPGPVRSLSGSVAVDGYPRSPASFHMVSVIASEANVYALVKAGLDPKAAVWTRRQVYGDRSPGEYVEAGRALMEISQKNAALAAFKASGFRIPAGEELPRAVSVVSGEVLGPSAGLAFALEIVSTLRKTDLTAGRKVAATGTLDSEGRVGSVGGIAQKAVACRENGIDVFLVPLSNAAEASRYAGLVRVMGVRTLDEALACLGVR